MITFTIKNDILKNNFLFKKDVVIKYEAGNNYFELDSSPIPFMFGDEICHFVLLGAGNITACGISIGMFKNGKETEKYPKFSLYRDKVNCLKCHKLLEKLTIKKLNQL